MSGIHIDRSRWPLVTTRFEGQTSKDDVVTKLAEWCEILGLRLRYANLIDLRNGIPGDNASREAIALWMRENRAGVEKVCVGTAIVVRSSMRAALSALMMKQPIPGHYALFSDLESAEAWLRQRFRECNLPPPPPPAASLTEPGQRPTP